MEISNRFLKLYLAAAAWIDLEIITLSQRKTDIMICLISEIQKNDKTNLSTKQKQSHRCRIMATKGERRWRINQEFGINIYTLPCIRQVNSKTPLYSTGNSAFMGKGPRKAWLGIYIYTHDSRGIGTHIYTYIYMIHVVQVHTHIHIYT